MCHRVCSFPVPRFWIDLLQDSLGLLEHSEAVFDVKQVRLCAGLVYAAAVLFFGCRALL